MDLATRKRRLAFRAWHRGTKEADILIGSFFDRECPQWGEAEVSYYEVLIEEDDVDVMAWAIGKQPVPAKYESPIMAAMQKLDYLPKPE